CAPRCCFRIVFDSVGSAGVVFGLTQGLTVARVHCRMVVVAAWSPCVASSVSCEHERLYRKLRVASLQVLGVCPLRTAPFFLYLYFYLGHVVHNFLIIVRTFLLYLFEFIAYLTGLNSNPFGSSDPWVAARPSGVPGGGPGGRVVTVGSNKICNGLINMAVPKKGTHALLARLCIVAISCSGVP
ncbi:hypothetical protein Taro_028939, partial [Colocasia esculenta]|nr:hypothetical protein [Colocasia esculenta]